MWYRKRGTCVLVLIEGNARVVFGRQATWMRRLKRIQIRSVLYVPLFFVSLSLLSLSLSYSLWIRIFFVCLYLYTIEYSRNDSKENIWCSLYCCFCSFQACVCGSCSMYSWLTMKIMRDWSLYSFNIFSWRTCNFDISFQCTFYTKPEFSIVLLYVIWFMAVQISVAEFFFIRRWYALLLFNSCRIFFCSCRGIVYADD